MSADQPEPTPILPASPADSLSERFQRGLIHRGGHYVIASPTGSWRGGAVGILRPAGPDSDARVWLVIPLEVAPAPEWFQKNPLPPGTVLSFVAGELPPPELAERFEEQAGLPVVIFAPSGQVGGLRGGEGDVVDELRRTLAYDDAALEAVNLDDAYRGLFAAERERAFHMALVKAVPKIWVTYAVIAACVGIWLAQLASGFSAQEDPSILLLLDWGASSGGLAASQPWRLLTAGFLHGGVLHLGLNMWMMFVLGRIGERLFGHVGYAAIFLLSIIGGFLGSGAWNPLAVAVGASGGIFGIMGAIVGFSLRRRGVLPVNVTKRLGLYVGLLVIANLGLTAWLSIRLPIDNAGHFGGLVVGFVAGVALAPPFPRPMTGDRRRLLWIPALLLVLAGCFTGFRAVPGVRAYQRLWDADLMPLALRVGNAYARTREVAEQERPAEGLPKVREDLNAVRRKVAALPAGSHDFERVRAAIVESAKAISMWSHDLNDSARVDATEQSLLRLDEALNEF